MERKYIIAGFLIILAIFLTTAVNFFVKNFMGYIGSLEYNKTINKDDEYYIYSNDEFGFRLRFPKSWNGMRIESPVRIEDDSVFSVLIPDKTKKERIIFQIHVIHGKYTNTREITEIFGRVGEYITHTNDFTYTFRYVYGTELDVEPKDISLSKALKDIDFILSTFETFSIKENR